MELPSQLPGLDINTALANIGGKTELYLKLLNIFLVNHTQDVSKISESIVQQDYKQACMQTHSLKGVCSNIGAMEVAKICQVIERKTKAEETVVQQELNLLEESFSQTLTSIEQILKDH